MNERDKKIIATFCWTIVFQFVLFIIVLCLFESAFNDFAVFLIIGGNYIIGEIAYYNMERKL